MIRDAAHFREPRQQTIPQEHDDQLKLQFRHVAHEPPSTQNAQNRG